MVLALDSNIIVYAVDPEAGHKYRIARAILSRASSLDINLPLQACGEVFAVLTRRRGWSAFEARDLVVGLADSLAVLTPTEATLRRAMQLTADHGIAFWDAHIAAVVADRGCDVLVTEDFQNGRIFSLRELGRTLTIINPFEESNIEMMISLGFEIA